MALPAMAFVLSIAMPVHVSDADWNRAVQTLAKAIRIGAPEAKVAAKELSSVPDARASLLLWETVQSQLVRLRRVSSERAESEAAIGTLKDAYDQWASKYLRQRVGASPGTDGCDEIP